MILRKDEALDRLAEFGNVAQFIAYNPGKTGLARTMSRLSGFPPNRAPDGLHEAVGFLLSASADGSVNIRSYFPDDPRSREFIYGVRSVEDAVSHLERLSSDGLHLIINETIDIHDGGVSGVVHGDVIEFAPDDTPRAVEKPGIASFDRQFGLGLLETVYGFAPELPNERDARVEFSIHPLPRGWRQTHTLLWEIEDEVGHRLPQTPIWPNRFSQHIGDKAFGLLVADALGFAVPSTTVIGRRVAPFAFGVPTGSPVIWIRTAPREPEPGYFTTAKGWRDPFALLASEDPNGRLSSVLSQAGVKAIYSGAAIAGSESRLIVEGKEGEGHRLMLGEASPEPLPRHIIADVEQLYRELTARLGPVRIEWVHDGSRVWIVQLHVGATSTSATTIVEGDADIWIAFDVGLGLTALRDLLESTPGDRGIEISGPVGLTSHIADVLRRSGRPARIRAR